MSLKLFIFHKQISITYYTYELTFAGCALVTFETYMVNPITTCTSNECDRFIQVKFTTKTRGLLGETADDI